MTSQIIRKVRFEIQGGEPFSPVAGAGRFRKYYHLNKFFRDHTGPDSFYGGGLKSFFNVSPTLNFDVWRTGPSTQSLSYLSRYNAAVRDAGIFVPIYGRAGAGETYDFDGLVSADNYRRVPTVIHPFNPDPTDAPYDSFASDRYYDHCIVQGSVSRWIDPDTNQVYEDHHPDRPTSYTGPTLHSEDQILSGGRYWPEMLRQFEQAVKFVLPPKSWTWDPDDIGAREVDQGDFSLALDGKMFRGELVGDVPDPEWVDLATQVDTPLIGLGDLTISAVSYWPYGYRERITRSMPHPLDGSEDRRWAFGSDRWDLGTAFPPFVNAQFFFTITGVQKFHPLAGYQLEVEPRLVSDMPRPNSDSPWMYSDGQEAPAVSDIRFTYDKFFPDTVAQVGPDWESPHRRGRGYDPDAPPAMYRDPNFCMGASSHATHFLIDAPLAADQTEGISEGREGTSEIQYDQYWATQINAQTYFNIDIGISIDGPSAISTWLIRPEYALHFTVGESFLDRQNRSWEVLNVEIQGDGGPGQLYRLNCQQVADIREEGPPRRE